MCSDVRLEGVAVSMYLSFALVGACLFCCEGLGGPVMAPPAFNCWRLYRREECVYVYVHVCRGGGEGCALCTFIEEIYTPQHTHKPPQSGHTPRPNPECHSRELWSSARQLLKYLKEH